MPHSHQTLDDTSRIPAVCVAGLGVVSPAGWGVSAFRQALLELRSISPKPLSRQGQRPGQGLVARQVPAPAVPPPFLLHPRLRRASPISHAVMGAALEALGEDATSPMVAAGRVGIIVSVGCGCMQYSTRFFDEVLRNPAQASPVLFPETVHNAPASHLGAFLNSAGPHYTLLGGPTAFLQALSVGGDWLTAGSVDACVVVGAEEAHWAIAEALRMFRTGLVLSEGAGALYLKRGPVAGASARLAAVSDTRTYFRQRDKAAALARVRQQLPPLRAGELLCAGTQDAPAWDQPEQEVWRDWHGRRLSPKQVLGEGLAAASAWQCVAAVDWLHRDEASAATVSVLGYNGLAIGARFESLPAGEGLIRS